MNFLLSPKSCPEVYCPMGGARVRMVEEGGVTAKPSQWLFGAPGSEGIKNVEGLLLHRQQCGFSGVRMRAGSSAWLRTQGLPVKNKVPVMIRLLPWPGFALSAYLPKKATARAGQLHQLSRRCTHMCIRPWLRWTVAPVHTCTHLHTSPRVYMHIPPYILAHLHVYTCVN